jgi:hypothetical protein
MISYERELDIYNKLNNCLKITGILNNVFRPQKKPLINKNKIIITIHWLSQFYHMEVKLGL